VTEDQGLEKLSEMTTQAEAAERLRMEARQRPKILGRNRPLVKVPSSYSPPPFN